MDLRFPPLKVRRHPAGVELAAHLEDGPFALVLAPGDDFGGRLFEEWMRVADECGSVTSDWLLDV